ncbi:MAG: CHAD domain-containing protein [Gemmatimonadota bacterium]
MSYVFARELTIQANVRLIAGSQLRDALRDIDDPELDVHATIHEVRKTCKKVRALLRLVRLVAEDLYGRENAAIRNSARRISEPRDLTANLESVDLLEDRFGSVLGREIFARLRSALEARRTARSHDLALDERVATVREELASTLERTDEWVVPDDGFDALAGGLGKTYGRAVRRMREAFSKPSSETWHEWRKRVKYHRYHTDLLEDIWEAVLDEREAQLHDLTDLLGDDNDLSELRVVLHDEPEWLDDEDAAVVLVALIDRLRAELQERTRPVARRVFAESPDKLVARYRSYWDAWQAEPEHVERADPVIEPGR